jgi:hypothetical protein
MKLNVNICGPSTEILLVQMGGCYLSMPSRSEGKDNQREKKVTFITSTQFCLLY